MHSLTIQELAVCRSPLACLPLSCKMKRVSEMAGEGGLLSMGDNSSPHSMKHSPLSTPRIPHQFFHQSMLGIVALPVPKDIPAGPTATPAMLTLSLPGLGSPTQSLKTPFQKSHISKTKAAAWHEGQWVPEGFCLITPLHMVFSQLPCSGNASGRQGEMLLSIGRTISSPAKRRGFSSLSSDPPPAHS